MLHLDPTDPPATAAAPAGPTLRDYQLDGIAEIRAAFAEHRRVLFVLPTGGGKTVIFSRITADTTARGERTVIVGHRQEIADQISLALTNLGVAHGLIRPDAPMTDHLVQVGMVQTLARRIDRLAAPSLLIEDECHHAVAATWARVAGAWPNARVLGVTATPERLDGKGLSDAFDVMVEGPDTAELIAQRWLAPIKYLAPDGNIDLSRVRTTGGDYNSGDLAGVLDHDAVTGDVIEHYLRHLGGRTAIAFCVTVAHAEHVALRFRNAGINAESIDGSMSPAERRAVVARLRSGGIRVLTSCEVVSEGFDVPAVGGCILLRPTQSLALYRQQIGRCLRPKPDGSDAVVLDHVGNCYQHGLPTDPHAWSLYSTRRTAADRNEPAATSRLRRCEACDAVFAAGAREAPCDGIAGCLWAPPRFIERPGRLQEVRPDAATDGSVWARVYAASGRLYQRPGGSLSLRLTFATSEHGPVSVYLNFNASSGSKWFAQRTWKLLARHKHLPPPQSSEEALRRFSAGELRRPARILLERDSAGWWRIRSHEFAADAEVAA